MTSMFRQYNDVEKSRHVAMILNNSAIQEVMMIHLNQIVTNI